jgi:DNA-binding SARP family transcriptional activator
VGTNDEGKAVLVLNIRVLGAVEVDSDGTVVRLARRQHRLLLGILALEVNRPVPADRSSTGWRD